MLIDTAMVDILTAMMETTISEKTTALKPTILQNTQGHMTELHPPTRENSAQLAKTTIMVLRTFV